MRKLIHSFYSIRMPLYSRYNNIISYHQAYYVVDNLRNYIISLGHKEWKDCGVDSKKISINGNYPFPIPPYEYDEGFDKNKIIFVNSRLTEKKYNELIKSDQIFNFMLQNNFPSYEVIELAKGIREIIHSDKKFNSLVVYINLELIDWDKLENTKELYVNC